MDKKQWEAMFGPKQSQSKSQTIGRSWLSELGKALQDERKRLNLDQGEIASRIQVNRSTLSRIENGHHQGSLKPLLAYMDYLGLEVAIKQKPTGLPQLGDNSLFEEDDDD